MDQLEAKLIDNVDLVTETADAVAEGEELTNEQAHVCVTLVLWATAKLGVMRRERDSFREEFTAESAEITENDF